MLIRSQVININIFDLMQKIYRLLVPSVISLSDREAQNFGFFLKEFFNQINLWQDPKTFDLECSENRCFTKDLSSPEKQVKLKMFRDVSKFIQTKISTIFQSYLKLEEFIPVNNTITVLNSIFELFPNTKEQGKELEVVITGIIENVKENDSKFKLSMYLVKLKEKLSLYENVEGKEETDKLKDKEGDKGKEVTRGEKVEKSEKDKGRKDKDGYSERGKEKNENSKEKNLQSKENRNRNIRDKEKEGMYGVKGKSGGVNNNNIAMSNHQTTNQNLKGEKSESYNIGSKKNIDSLSDINKGNNKRRNKHHHMREDRTNREASNYSTEIINLDKEDKKPDKKER
mmetsp:Transcript_2207/g.2263  ORF Transcript_2207/g.2263 Transcript_2207/m.2263 type:complete len:342 (+) Transcript_2207:1170-2195(+)